MLFDDLPGKPTPAERHWIDVPCQGYANENGSAILSPPFKHRVILAELDTRPIVQTPSQYFAKLDFTRLFRIFCVDFACFGQQNEILLNPLLCSAA